MRSGLLCLSWVICALALSASCVGSQSVTCSDGRTCPNALVCDNTHKKCVTPGQLATCKGQPNNTPCTLPDNTMGGCLDEVCLAVGCGNGVVEAGEVCDDANQISGDGCSAKCDSTEQCGNGFLDPLKGEACDCGDASVPDSQRPPGCNGPNSDADGSVCLTSCKIRGCGDGVIAGLEDCEAGNVNGKTCQDVGYYSGTLACSSLCRFDVSSCSGKCGDGSVNDPGGGELCDGTDLAGKTCQTFGFYNSAGLKCNALCGFDTSSCTGRCGDGTKNGSELCDGTQLGGKDCSDFGFYTAAGLACSTACNFDTTACSGGYCGDGTISNGEKCDTAQLGGKTCSDFGFYQSAGLACSQICDYDTSACTGGRCGDGTKNGSESCDTTDFGGQTCQTFGYYGTTGLSCTSACGITTAGCTGGFCGDGIVQTGAGEECDGSALNGGTCTAKGFYGGTLTCGPTCKWNTAGCSGTCGDGVKNGTEICDGSDVGGQGCSNYGFYTGSLSCNGSCSAVVTSGCSQKCNDGIKNGSEACDGNDVGTVNCTAFGYYGTSGLTCNGSCTGFVTTNCTGGRCGDGMINGTEDCDGSNFAGANCTSFGYYYPDTLKCTSRCAIDESSCTGYCGDRTVNGPTGWTESCDSQSPSGDTCLAWGYESGPPGCRADCGLDFSRCVHSGWYQTGPASASSYYLSASWGSGPNDVWVTVFANILYHWNGASWSTVTLSGSETYFGIWGTAANNVFIVGSNGSVQHYNGSTWTASTAVVTANRLLGIWGDGAGTLVAVGENGLLVRSTNSGGSWTQPTSGTTQTLYGVWGAGATVFAVGEFGTVRRSTDGGATWSTLTPPFGNSLYAVWGTDSTHVYFSGSSGMVWQFNGTTFTQMTTNTTQSLRGIWGVGTSDIFAAGDESIIHWDGASWSMQYNQAAAGFVSVWGSIWNAGGPPDVFATGPGGALVRYNREAWTSTTAGTGNNLVGAWAYSATDAYVFGAYNTISHYDGSAWTPQSFGTWNGSVRDMWGTSSTNVFAVGDGGKYARYTGIWSSPASTGTTNALRGLWGSSTNDIIAVGDAGTIMHWTGSSWAPMTSNTSNTLNGVWGAASNDVYAVGALGTIQHYNGSTWSAMTFPFTDYLLAVWGSGSKDVWVASLTGGVVYHYDGTNWTFRTLKTNNSWRDVWGTGPDDVYVVGDSGQIFHFDGLVFAQMRTDSTTLLAGIWGSGSRLFVAASLDKVFVRDRACASSETACSDGRDEDCDGLTDCADPQCAASSFCTTGGMCNGYGTLTCNGSTPGTLAGGQTNLEGIGCDTWLRTGRENTYRITPTNSGNVSVTISAPTNDLDLEVFASTNGGACNPYGPGCLGVSANTDKSGEAVSFLAQAGTTYYVVVDSYGSYSATYTLAATCP